MMSLQIFLKLAKKKICTLEEHIGGIYGTWHATSKKFRRRNNGLYDIKFNFVV